MIVIIKSYDEPFFSIYLYSTYTSLSVQKWYISLRTNLEAISHSERIENDIFMHFTLYDLTHDSLFPVDKDCSMYLYAIHYSGLCDRRGGGHLLLVQRYFFPLGHHHTLSHIMILKTFTEIDGYAIPW